VLESAGVLQAAFFGGRRRSVTVISASPSFMSFIRVGTPIVFRIRGVISVVQLSKPGRRLVALLTIAENVFHELGVATDEDTTTCNVCKAIRFLVLGVSEEPTSSRPCIQLESFGAWDADVRVAPEDVEVCQQQSLAVPHFVW